MKKKLLFITFSIFVCVTIQAQINWKTHFEKELLPFWDTEQALGKPIGNFPTFRCNDGSVNECIELNISELDDWVKEQSDNLNRDYIRTKSRQTFLYGVAYHLTGNDKYLYYAKCGVDYIRKHIRPSGLIYSYHLPHNHYNSKEICSACETENQHSFGPDSIHVTSQDLSYALNGLTFYYYLTRDKDVLNDILKVKNYIFKYYKDTTDNFIKWSLCNHKLCSEYKTELVSYLDQVNAYLVLLTPLIKDKKIRSECLKELEMFCKTVKSPLFYNEKTNMIWGKTKYKKHYQQSSDPLRKVGTGFHTDYGHTVKTYWMFYLIGNLLENESYAEFGKSNAYKIFNKAYIKDKGAWGCSPNELKNKSWWIYAELDQAAALFSLEDNELYKKYLKQTYKVWEEKFTDPEHCEVYPSLDENNEPYVENLKINHWKNGFHSAEHALFGYITNKTEPIELYFAFDNSFDISKGSYIKPYYFDGEIENKTPLKFKNKDALELFSKSNKKVKITFKDISNIRIY